MHNVCCGNVLYDGVYCIVNKLFRQTKNKIFINMLKKLFTLGMLAGLLAVSTNSFAQEEPEYPHYGFWSNWSLGASIDIVHQGTHGWDWGKGLSFGASILVEKELNHVWDFRFSMNAPGLYQKCVTKSDYTDNAGNFDATGYNKACAARFDRYVTMLAGFKFSINNAILGYNPERKSNFYLLLSAGLGWHRDEANLEEGTIEKDWNTDLAAQGGIGYSYQICEHSTIFAELFVDDHAVLPNVFKHRRWLDGGLAIGYLYNFGPTAADRELLNQKSLLTQENFDELHNRVNELQNSLDNANNRIKQLENRIEELEKERDEALANKGNSAAADSLQKVIDQIKEDQMTYYALPFSILFGVDEYTVNDTEMVKINAVAQVMKDNPDVNFNVYGFCDKSGSDAYNQKLSEKRAKEVKRLLVKKGVAEGRLSIAGYGKSKAFGDSKYAVNRRVSFYRVIE